MTTRPALLVRWHPNPQARPLSASGLTRWECAYCLTRGVGKNFRIAYRDWSIHFQAGCQ